MADVIDLNSRKDPLAVKLFELGGDIDQLILFYIDTYKLDLFEVAGVISHRLGECIRNLPSPEHQGDVLIDIVLTRAGLNNG